jgi:hypothetical protein
MVARTLTVALGEKVLMMLERTEHLVSLVPVTQLDWRPTTSAGTVELSDLGHVLGHLLDCTAGFCAVLHAAFPKKLASLAELKSAKVNHYCEPEEWRKRIRVYRAGIVRGFELCTDRDLGRLLKTVFAPKGETLFSVSLGNLEHLVNHKYQLFFYLKLLGIPVGTEDLYHLRKPMPRATK